MVPYIAKCHNVFAIYVIQVIVMQYVGLWKNTRRMAIANRTCISFCNQPKAHFGLHRDNHGKCHMVGKRIQCWSNA